VDQTSFEPCAFALLQDPATCSEELLSALVGRLQDGRQPAVLRATCAAYAASFLARASFVPDALVVQALQVWSVHCALPALCSRWRHGKGTHTHWR